MNIWIPYIEGASGADISTRSLAEGLLRRGHRVFLQKFNRYYQFVPHLLKTVSPPRKTDIIVTNTWYGFAFQRGTIPSVAVERLFILDPTLAPYKSILQRIFHNMVLKNYIVRSVDAANATVAVSEYTAKALSVCLDRPMPHVILNAVDTNFFKPPDPPLPPTSRDKIRLLFVGNLSRRKGADMLVPILELLGPRYELAFTAGLGQRMISINASSRCTPLGTLDKHGMREAYRHADILLFPSRGEGLSRAVMESMACGTPVVASHISSLPEALSSGGGRLSNVDDPSHFAHTIQAMVHNLEELSREARAAAIQLFSLERMIDQYIALFESLRTQYPPRDVLFDESSFPHKLNPH